MGFTEKKMGNEGSNISRRSVALKSAWGWLAVMAVFLFVGAGTACKKDATEPAAGPGAASGETGEKHWDKKGALWKEARSREEFGSDDKLECEAGAQGCICKTPTFSCEEGAECFWGHCYGEDFPVPDTYRYTDKARSDYYAFLKLIMNELDLAPGMNVADLGAGQGKYVERIAKKVGADGIVYATDTDSGAVDRLNEMKGKLGKEGVAKLEVIKVDERRETGLTSVPDNHLDRVLMVNSVTFDRPEDKEADINYLGTLYKKLKPGGSVVYHSDWFAETGKPSPSRGGWAGSGGGLSREDLIGYFSKAGFNPAVREVPMPSHIPETTYFVQYRKGGKVIKRNLYRGFIFFFEKTAK